VTAPFPAPEPLAPRHRVAGFDCGEPDIDNYLINHAAQEAELGLSRTWVIASPEDGLVLGYVSLSAASQAVRVKVQGKLNLVTGIPAITSGHFGPPASSLPASSPQPPAPSLQPVLALPGCGAWPAYGLPSVSKTPSCPSVSAMRTTSRRTRRLPKRSRRRASRVRPNQAAKYSAEVLPMGRTRISSLGAR
jgi:hypothetical protein